MIRPVAAATSSSGMVNDRDERAARVGGGGYRAIPRKDRLSAGIGTLSKRGSSGQSTTAIASTPSVEGGAVMHAKQPINPRPATPTQCETLEKMLETGHMAVMAGNLLYLTKETSFQGTHPTDTKQLSRSSPPQSLVTRIDPVQ